LIGIFLAGQFLVGVVALLFFRSQELSVYEIKHGNYPGFWEMLTKGGLVLHLVRTRYSAFISFKAEPDEQDASRLARELKACGLEVAIFEDRLEPTVLVQNVGKDIGFRKYISNRLMQSSTMVLVASQKSFSSNWVTDEFTMAMRSSNLVVMLIVDSTDPENLLPYHSSVFRWKTMTAPVYALHTVADLKATAKSGAFRSGAIQVVTPAAISELDPRDR
jgi:hypothetical protein